MNDMSLSKVQADPKVTDSCPCISRGRLANTAPPVLNAKGNLYEGLPTSLCEAGAHGSIAERHTVMDTPGIGAE
jgi:hypothetical protein